MFESKLDAMAREKVERTINAMLDAEADEIANAAGYERRTGRKAFRAGHYGRTLAAKAGKLSLKVPEFVFCQVVIGQCGVSFPSEKAVGFSPVRNWPVIARVLLFHCIRA